VSSGASRRLQRAKQAAKRRREAGSGGKAAAPGTSAGHGGNPYHDVRGRFTTGPSSGQAASPPTTRGAKAAGPEKGQAPKRKAPRRGAKARLAEAKARVAAKEGVRSANPSSATSPIAGSQWYQDFAAKYGAENVQWARVPEYAGGKTQGVLATSVGDVDLISGYTGPSAAMPPGAVPGMNNIIRAHVEGHAASAMRQLGLNDATLYLNQTPCIWSNGSGCNSMLLRMLGRGRQLRVVVPGRMNRIYVGVEP